MVNQRSFFSYGLLALASHASAQVASVCPSTGVCFKLNIPEATASSGNGDIFFQISGPSSYEYVALGQGRGMSGSNIFAIYTSRDGTNVTLSPRLGTGTQMPRYNANAQVELLEGSGVSNGVMTANVKCSNCNSWSGGTADFTATSGNWIYAYESSGGPKNSDSQSETISQHSSRGVFSWNYAGAKGGSTVNPLVNVAPSATGTGAAATPSNCIPRPSQTGGSASASAVNPTQTSTTNNPGTTLSFPSTRPTARPSGFPFSKRQSLPYCDEVTDGTTSGSFTPIGATSASSTTKMLIAHGVLGALAFVILFPAGAIAIRLASFPGVVWLHAAFQIFAFVVYVAAVGLGAYMVKDLEEFDHHHIIGMLVFVLIFFQPILGFLHHKLFKKYQSRTLWSYAHIWLGRFAITAGIVNGGLGLRLADQMNMSSRPGIIAYSVVAGIMWLAWVAAMFVGKRRRAAAKMGGGQTLKEERNPRGSDTEAAEVNLPMSRFSGHHGPNRGQ